LEENMLNRRGKIALLSVLVGCWVSACANVKEAGRTVGHTTRDVTKEIGHTTRDVTREIGHGTRDAAKTVGQGVKDAVKSATDDEK
jgi:hypothetical protein